MVVLKKVTPLKVISWINTGTSAKTLIIECNGSKMRRIWTILIPIVGVCTVKVIDSHCISDCWYGM